MAALLTNASATVTVCHSRTRDLGAVCRAADILIAAVGSPRMVQGDWVKPGATVIDVGINRTDDGLVGDVDFEPAAEVAGAITPGPGRRRADDDRDAPSQHAWRGRELPTFRRASGIGSARRRPSRAPQELNPTREIEWTQVVSDRGR